MSFEKISGVRRWMWLVGGLLLLLSAASIYGVARDPGETLSFPSLGVNSAHPEEFVPEINVEQLSESLAQALNRHLDKRVRHTLEELKESRFAQTQLIEEWKERLDVKIEMQASKLADLDQKLDSIKYEINQLLNTLEDEALEPSMEPTFVFRGIEIWHGQIYALLEYEGRIVPVREGESRLGWRIHVIDRDSQKLHVGDGMKEYVLEVQ
ncbi:MAG: hypothetical protein OXN23_00785 [Gammaproteobacteria bacterium]|nr:hypothetical protein [Gammaproteobacteria bacterium]MDE0612293.1 hypothetical protein [Gammaproteobacteria bacterium]